MGLYSEGRGLIISGLFASTVDYEQSLIFLRDRVASSRRVFSREVVSTRFARARPLDP